MHVTDDSTVRKLRRSTPVIYQVFDLLYADGEDLTRKPLRERLRRLDEALTPMGAIRRSEGFVGTGVALFEAAKEQGLEGIIAKRLDSTYQPGARSPAWVKVKAFRTMDCVIGGGEAGQGGRASTLGALLLGVYRDGKLQPVGHVGTGFDERTLKDLLATLEKHESPTSPFATQPRTNQPARWCLPELVCEVEYAEITRDGTLRHPTYRGLRPDVDPRDATGEERSESAKKAQDAAKRAVTAPAPSENGGQAARVPSVLEVEGKRIKLTNLEKILFPEDGYTKADLIRYYTEVSPYLVPWLRDRPLTLKPFPDGIAGQSFRSEERRVGKEYRSRWAAYH